MDKFRIVHFTENGLQFTDEDIIEASDAGTAAYHVGSLYKVDEDGNGVGINTLEGFGVFIPSSKLSHILAINVDAFENLPEADEDEGEVDEWT